MSAELRALLVFFLIVALGWVGYASVFSDAAGVQVVLYEVQGRVEVESGGTRSAAEVGSAIGSSDRISAGEDGRAVLALGGHFFDQLKQSLYCAVSANHPPDISGRTVDVRLDEI